MSGTAPESAAREDPAYKEPPLKITADAERHDHRQGNGDYTQADNLFRLMPADERRRLVNAIAGAMVGVPPEIQQRQIEHFTRADPNYGRGVAEALTRDA